MVTDKALSPIQGSCPPLTRPAVWGIAASDSGGGAGIQADNLTIHDLGAHACNIVTAITAQNSLGVSAVSAVSLEMLNQQLTRLLDDIPPQAIKIGVLANASQIRYLSQWLATTFAAYQQQHQLRVPIIWDPVMLASSGQPITELHDEPSLDDYLLLAKQVTLLTPNASECARLINNKHLIEGTEQWLLLLEVLANHLKTNVLLTGGHLDPQLATDWLASQQLDHTSDAHQGQILGFQLPLLDTPHNHGTGCTYSAAIASAMALGYPMLDAICVAKAYVNQGLRASYAVGQGPGVLARCGWPETLSDFPQILLRDYSNLTNNSQLSFAPLQLPLHVYPVTQSLPVLEQVLKAGARTVQLRLKSPVDPLQLEQQIQRAVELGRQYQAQVIINDHWQLAIKYAACGVHLGQEDMLEADLSQIAAAGLALGLSSHGYFELLLARQLSPSYLAIGHIFATPTKTMPSQAQGLSKLQRYCRLLKGQLPLIAIGGIDRDKLPAIHRCGVDDVAVVRAVEQAADPGLSWQQLQQSWQKLEEQGTA